MEKYKENIQKWNMKKCKDSQIKYFKHTITHNQTFTDDSECSGTTGLQRAQKSPCNTSLYLLALATSCSSYQVQDTNACI